MKNREKFSLPDSRKGEVKRGAEVIVIYERWRRLGNPQLLQSIADYNQLDCSSTRQCRDWLASLRPAEMPWYLYEPEPQKADKVDERTEAEQRVAAMAAEIGRASCRERVWQYV